MQRDSLVAVDIDSKVLIIHGLVGAISADIENDLAERVTQFGILLAYGETGADTLALDVINGATQKIKVFTGIKRKEPFIGLERVGKLRIQTSGCEILPDFFLCSVQNQFSARV